MYFPGKNWKRLVPNAANLTDAELQELANTRAGKAALEQDTADFHEAARNAKSVNLTDAETGETITKFTNQAQRDRAYRNPLYQSSPAFRDAVAAAEQNSMEADPVPYEPGMSKGQFSGTAKGTDANAMLQAAREDAARAHVRKMFHDAADEHSPDAAIARVKIMEMMTSEDPQVQEMVRFATGVHHGDPKPIEDAIKGMRGTGMPARIQRTGDEDDVQSGQEGRRGSLAGHVKDIDFSKPGFYRDGTKIPETAAIVLTHEKGSIQHGGDGN